jgi:hypothetical protein
MSSIEKDLLQLKEYESKLENDTYALRVGNEVPEEDVNLAYIHTPRLDPEQNISLVDTSSIPDNVIPEDQLESIVIPDHSGKLQYANIHSEYEPVKPKPPYDVFPSKDFYLTREFKRNEHTTDNALYYKIELKYHYDSQKGIPNKVVKYTGTQIEITDENGNPLDDTYKYEIYVMAMEQNPQIYWVKIYLAFNTDQEKTFKVRYNHIDDVVPNENIQSVRNTIELYSNRKNQLVVDGKAKSLLEGGKLRIINGVSAYEEVSETDFAQATENDEVYKIVENPQKGGYEIYVPQKSENDPRTYDMFNYKIVAKYKDETGKDQVVTVGYINDWVMDPKALLNHEKLEYTKEWKHIGIPAGNTKLNIKDMINLSLPLGTPSVPKEATYEIYDAVGNLLYTTTDATDNPNVDTRIQERQEAIAEAKSNRTTNEWKNAKKKNTRVISKPIPHRCSVIAERQKTKWDFAFKVTGQGEIRRTTVFTANWWACANVGIYKGFTTKPLDVVDKNKWQAFGNKVTVNDWKLKSSNNGLSYLELQVNEVDVAGFYQKVNPKGESMANKTDYEFTAKVRIADPGDDDVIGIIFRVQDSKHYYMFAWEKEKLHAEPYTYTNKDGDGSIAGTVNGVGRIVFSSQGCTSLHYHPEVPSSQIGSDGWYEPSDKYVTNNWVDYENAGFGKQKKRIFKVSPQSGTPYKNDVTGCSFTDITTKGTLFYSEAGRKGWEPFKTYKITVVVAGSSFKVYINENADSSDKGTLVCEAVDSTYTQGSVGIFCTSQRWTQWYELIYNELDVLTVCTDRYPVTLTSQEQKKISDKTVEELLKDKITQEATSKYGPNTKYMVFSYYAQSDRSELYLDIDQNGIGYVWGRTDSPLAGGTVIEPWDTTTYGLDVYGAGTVQYHEDGHFTIDITPQRLPMDIIPSEVVNFRWNPPILISGENVSLSLGADNQTIIVQAQKPPIIQLNKWITLPEDTILKEEKIKHLVNVFGEDGIYEQLNIPKDIPIDEILLRIERGKATGAFSATDQEHRVNYRFRCLANGLVKMPVDQFQDQLGVNRIRLSSLFTTYKPVEFDLKYRVYVEKKNVTDMKDLFAVGASGAVMIEPTPGAATWKIENNILKDVENNYKFVGAYNQQHLSLKDYKVDFAFKPVGSDDDLIGVLFRVQDKNNFYFYAIEADDINPMMGASRVSSEQPAPLFDWEDTPRSSATSNSDYILNKGWRTYHQRVYKVENGVKTLVKEISTTTNEGWMRNWQNNIRIECIGYQTKLYFQTGLPEEEKWKLVYTVDTKWNKGAFGVFNYSQRVEFLNITMTDLIPIEGQITGLKATGYPHAIFTENVRKYCDPYVRDSIEKAGFPRDSRYIPDSYEAIKKTSEGNVIVAANGNGPLQVFSVIDAEKRNADVDIVAWTHYEDLEAVPIFAIKMADPKKIRIEKPKVEQRHIEVENWYVRIKNGKFQKRIALPYYEPEEKTPQIYVAYPELMSYAPSSPEERKEVILEYSIPEYVNQEFYDRPIVLIEREYPIILDEYSIQTRHAPIALFSEYQISYLEVEAIRKNHARKLRIADVDAAKGIIYLHDRIREQDEVIVRYAYKEDWYTYRGFMADEEYEEKEIIINEERNYAFAYNLKLDGTVTYMPSRQPGAKIPFSDGNVSCIINNWYNWVNLGELFELYLEDFSKPYVQFSCTVIEQDPELSVGFGYGISKPHIHVFAGATKEGVYKAKVQISFVDGTSSIIELSFAFGPTSITETYSNEDNGNYQITHTTGDVEETKDVVVKTISVKDLFPNMNPSVQAIIQLQPILNITKNTNIKSYSFTYESDGKSIDERPATYNDKIIVKISYVIPVLKSIEYIPKGTGVFFHLDLNPSPGHRITLAKRGILKWIPINTEQQNYAVLDESSTQLLAKPINIYLRPSLIRDIQGNIIEGTQSNQTIYHTDEEHWFDPNDYYHDPTMFRLGKIFVQANSNIEQDMIILDTRSRGGGLDEALSREIIEAVNKESLYHWDIGYFDGEAYQENGVIIIRLPNTILQRFSEAEVQAAVAKHKAYGVLPIIEYYDAAQIDRHKNNVLLNPEFYNGEHITYHNPSLDSGTYEIKNMDLGTGDNYILVLYNNARYGITIPGHHFATHNAYRVEIKAKKDSKAVLRSAATIEVVYEDNSKQTYQAPLINSNEWAIYKQVFTKEKTIKYVNIILNDSNPKATGTIYIDYVLVFPHILYDPVSTEIQEI